jgi:glycosyltransferase involved in cell wall biosynthesis
MFQEKKLVINTSLCPKSYHQGWMKSEYEKGLVSVIIPTYNRANLLLDAIESVWKQTYRPLELLVIDDSSTDNTKSVVEEWEKKCSHSSDFIIRYLYQSHQGAQAARNLGLIESRGEYIQFLDSDDVLMPKKTEWGVIVLNNSPKSFVYFRTQMADENLNPTPGHFYGKKTSLWHNDVVDYLWHTSSPLYRRNVLKEIGPWLETLSGTQDWEYGARIKLCGYQAIYDQKIGSLVRKHQGQRIGVQGFHYKYTYSAELAYDYIVQLADEFNCMNDLLGPRFVRLYLTRALEYHNAEYYHERDRCLQKALSLPSVRNTVWFITWLCQFLPNKFLLNLINKILLMRRRRMSKLKQAKSLAFF